VVGDGPDRRRLQSMAGPNVVFTGQVTRAQVIDYMKNAYAFVFPGLEDFGIAAVEANASGKPVLAFGGGGALETIVAGETGLFFMEQTVASLNDTLADFERIAWNSMAARRNAVRFGEARFAAEIRSLVDAVAVRA